ncbi:MAG: putative transporter permease protein [Chloroflexi bacterium]|jgi:putative ABC transport system permease protein|nr:putative transporter permease protein [Chloroflexota bacterium]
MHPSKVIQIAWKGLAKNKLRSLLTMLGVIIGVAAVIIMVSISAGTEKTIEEQITSLGSNLIFISQNFTRMGFGGGPGERGGETGGLVFDDAFAIADQVEGVTGVAVEQQSAETVEFGDVSLDSVEILGTTPDFPAVRDMTIAEGRYFTQQEDDRKQKVAVLGASLAEELFGDATAVGQTVNVGGVKLAVIGVLAERGMVGNVDFDMRLYTPISVVFQKFTPSMFARIMGDRVRMIYAKVDTDQVPMEDIILQIQLLLAKRHDVSLDAADFSITTQQDIISTQESTTAAFRDLLAWVAAVSLVVGGIGIMNIMLVSVTERTREIGLRQAVGATPNDIRWQFLTEALLLSLVGGLIGVLVGVGGAWLFGELGGMRTVVVPTSIVLAFASAAAVGIFFGFYPANKAAQLDPIEALRHE